MVLGFPKAMLYPVMCPLKRINLGWQLKNKNPFLTKAPEEHTSRTSSSPHFSQFHKCVLITTLKIKWQNCYLAAWPMGCKQNQHNVSSTTATARSQAAMWALPCWVVWPFPFHSWEIHSASPTFTSQPDPSAFCAWVKQFFPADLTH